MEGFAYQIVIASTAEKVWESLTGEEFTRKFWFGRSVRSGWKVGDEVTIVTPEGAVEMRGKVTVAERPTKLSYTWTAPLDPNLARGETLVTFEIQAMGPLVKLTVNQNLDPQTKDFLMAAQGWTFILNGLKTFLETGAPMPALPWKKPE